MKANQSPRYIGPIVTTRLPENVIDWYDRKASADEMSRAEYVREVLLEHYDIVKKET